MFILRQPLLVSEPLKVSPELTSFVVIFTAPCVQLATNGESALLATIATAPYALMTCMGSGRCTIFCKGPKQVADQGVQVTKVYQRTMAEAAYKIVLVRHGESVW